MTYPISTERTFLDGVVLLRRERHRDHRGSLNRIFDVDIVQSLVPDFSVAQVNHTVTLRRGTVRGLHFQVQPYSDVRVVTCQRGRVFDVVVDIRRGSSTFLEWYGMELDCNDSVSLLLNRGFAHGFQALSDDCEMLYVHGERYHQEAEGGLHVADPILNISWPEPVATMSSRDQTHPMLDRNWLGIDV